MSANKDNEAPERIWISPRQAWMYAKSEGLRDPCDTEKYARVDPSTGKVETVESALVELREMFPVLTITVNVYANWAFDRRDKDFVTIRLFGATTTPHTLEFNAPTIGEAMAQVRAWKESQ